MTNDQKESHSFFKCSLLAFEIKTYVLSQNLWVVKLWTIVALDYLYSNYE